MSVDEPEFLSHYTSLEVLHKIVESGTMWATDLFFMNDAAEFRFSIELIRSMLDCYTPVKPHAEAVLDHFSEIEDVGNDQTLFSISFSEEEDLLSQWRSYCPDSGGVSISFNTSILKELGCTAGFQLFKCIYDEIEQKEVLTGVLESAIRIKDSRGIDAEVRKVLVDGILKFAPMMKHPSFAEEREWRLVTEPMGFYEDRVQYRNGTSMLIPYTPMCIVQEDLLGFNHVTIGPNRSPDLAWLSTHRFLKRKFLDGKLAGFFPSFVRTSKTPFRTL